MDRRYGAERRRPRSRVAQVADRGRARKKPGPRAFQKAVLYLNKSDLILNLKDQRQLICKFKNVLSEGLRVRFTSIFATAHGIV
jgi:hypothetical protein